MKTSVYLTSLRTQGIKKYHSDFEKEWLNNRKMHVIIAIQLLLENHNLEHANLKDTGDLERNANLRQPQTMDLVAFAVLTSGYFASFFGGTSSNLHDIFGKEIFPQNRDLDLNFVLGSYRFYRRRRRPHVRHSEGSVAERISLLGQQRADRKRSRANDAILIIRFYELLLGPLFMYRAGSTRTGGS